MALNLLAPYRRTGNTWGSVNTGSHPLFNPSILRTYNIWHYYATPYGGFKNTVFYKTIHNWPGSIRWFKLKRVKLKNVQQSCQLWVHHILFSVISWEQKADRSSRMNSDLEASSGAKSQQWLKENWKVQEAAWRNFKTSITKNGWKKFVCKFLLGLLWVVFKDWRLYQNRTIETRLLVWESNMILQELPSVSCPWKLTFLWCRIDRRQIRGWEFRAFLPKTLRNYCQVEFSINHRPLMHCNFCHEMQNWWWGQDAAGPRL